MVGLKIFFLLLRWDLTLCIQDKQHALFMLFRYHSVNSVLHHRLYMFLGLFWNNYYLLLHLLLFYLWLRMYFVKWTLIQLSPQPFHPWSQCPLSCTCPNQTSFPHSIMCKETDKIDWDQFHTKDHYKVEQVCCLFLRRMLCSSCWL